MTTESTGDEYEISPELAQRIAEITPEQTKALAAAVERLHPALTRMCDEVSAGIANVVQPAVLNFSRTLSEVSLPVLDTSWAEPLLEAVQGLQLNDQNRRDMVATLSRVADMAASLDLDAELPDAADGDLEELGAQGVTFATTQGAALSREAQRKLALYFVGALVFMLLMQGMVQSEAVNDLVQKAGVAGPAAVLAMAVTARQFDKLFPPPPSDDETAE
ncbi:hypothetical protein [Streptomyces parvus]|uniref:Uncharacterized protein n=1 Tax=Streptomyces parvus TaxID=66428 RepID=A0A7K3RST8_9ACTN|nr:hypothetical protein [Streptomyces parvus]NEC17942.1 hypothetical protein [Streptomyces parvus]